MKNKEKISFYFVNQESGSKLRCVQNMPKVHNNLLTNTEELWASKLKPMTMARFLHTKTKCFNRLS